jgi:hypothetical protein
MARHTIFLSVLYTSFVSIAKGRALGREVVGKALMEGECNYLLIIMGRLG